MGAYNIVKLSEKCEFCGQTIERKIQFKYGEVWQHEYELGEELVWGANQVGEPGFTQVVVDGAGEDCPNCQGEGADYEVWVTSGKILDVRRATGKFDFVKTQAIFIIIQP